MAAPTGFFRGENGIVLEMDLPLGDAYAGRITRGELVRVEADGVPWTEPDPAPADPGDQDATAAALVDALGQIDDLTAELELANKQRDALAVELGDANAKLADLAAVRQDDGDTPAKPKATRAGNK